MILAKENNTLYLLGTIYPGDGMWFVSELAKMEKIYNDITIRIHTYGGSVFDGNIMCNALEASRTNISIEIIGIAASMGAILTMSAKNVKIVENGFLMLHAPHSYTSGDAKTHENTAKVLRSIEGSFLKRLSVRLKQPIDAVKQYMQGDNWIDAEEALKLGLVSEVIPSQIETILPVEHPEDMEEIEVYNLYSSILTQIPKALNKENSTDINKINFNDKMKQLLITAFALQLTEQSSDTAFINALQDKFNELKGDLQNAQDAKTQAENKLQEFEKQRIETLIKEANISEDQKEVYQKIGETSGVDALAEILKDKKKTTAPKLSAMIQSTGVQATATRNSWDFDQWQREDPKGLEKLSQENPDKFKELFNAKYKK